MFTCSFSRVILIFKIQQSEIPARYYYQ